MKGISTVRVWPSVLAAHDLSHVASGSHLAASCAKCKLRAADSSQVVVGVEPKSTEKVDLLTIFQPRHAWRTVIGRKSGGLTVFFNDICVASCKETIMVTYSEEDSSNLLNILSSPGKSIWCDGGL